MKIILDGQIMFSIGIISKMMMYFLLDVMIGKKEKRVGIALLCVAHFLIYNVGILIVMDRLFGKEQWFQLLMPTCSLFLATGSVAAFSLLTKNSFFKMLLECVVADAICGVIIYIDRELFSDPLSLFIFAAVVFVVFYVMSRPLLKKCRTLQMGHSWIVGGFLLIALINSWFSNILYVLEKEKMLANSMQLVSFLQIVIVLFAVLMECIIYYLVLKRKYKMLLRRNEQMESYYRQAAKHIRDMETGWDFLGGGVARTEVFSLSTMIYQKKEDLRQGMYLNRRKDICRN